MKKNLKITLITLAFMGSLLISVIPTAFSAEYTPLAPLTLPDSSKVSSVNLVDYLQGMVVLLIAVAGALAFFEIIWGGFWYMTSDAVGGKSNALEKIQKAVYGLLLAIASYAILYTIDPNLLNINFFK